MKQPVLFFTFLFYYLSVMKKYKAICFDVDGTLYPVETLIKILDGIEERDPQVKFQYSAARKRLREIQDSPKRNLIPQCKTFRDMEIWCFQQEFPRKITWEEAESMSERYYSILNEQYSILAPQNCVIETLKDIRNSGYKIGVFSDWPFYDKLRLLGVNDLIDCKFDCFDGTHLKPSPRAFDSMIKTLNIKPSDIMYVGDSYERDGLGAINAGMDAVLVNSECKLTEVPGCLAVFRDFISFREWLLDSSIIEHRS